jgi:hypothetical protein
VVSCLKIFNRQKATRYEISHRASADSLERPRQWKIEVRFEAYIARSLCKLGSLKIAASELAKYKFDFVVVRQVRWDKGGSEPETIIRLSMEMGMLGTSCFFFVHM